MLQFLWVGLGGFLGAVARYGVSLLVARLWSGEFPLATLLANVGGSFVLGFFASFSAGRLGVDPGLRLMIATGFIGSFTTFSTFEYETHRLLETGAWAWAGLNVLGSLGAGLLAVHLGAELGR
jgi:fluoride exporter